MFAALLKKSGFIHSVDSDIGGYSGWVRGQEKYNNQKYKCRCLQNIRGNNGRHIEKEDRRG